MSVLHIVKVENVGDKAFDVPHNGVVTTIEPGKTAVVTWDAACSSFGDPTLQDLPRNPVRLDRYAALRAQWNYHVGFDAQTEADREVSPSATGSWEAKRPYIRVTTVDTDEEIVMLIDDPKGASVLPESVSGRSDLDVSNAAQVNATIEALQDQVARLTNVLAVLDPSVMDRTESELIRDRKLHPDRDKDFAGRVLGPAEVVDDEPDPAPESHQADATALVAAPVALPEDDGPEPTPAPTRPKK